jgi:hypothetical protein
LNTNLKEVNSILVSIENSIIERTKNNNELFIDLEKGAQSNIIVHFVAIITQRQQTDRQQRHAFFHRDNNTNIQTTLTK